jgi:hypothetical protein
MQSRIQIGAVIRRVFDIYFDQAPVLMPAAATVFVFSGLLSILAVRGGSGLNLLALLIGVVATSLFAGMVVELVADVRDGRRESNWRALVRSVLPVLGQVIAVAIVIGVCVTIGLFVLVVPGLILITIWSVVAPVVVLERPGGLAPLRRSRELVRGNGWQVFGVIAVLVIGVGIVSAIIEAAADSGGTGVGIVVRVIIEILTAPLSALAASVLYFELRGPIAQATPGERAVESAL